jgi:hypothetical protein
MGSKRSGSKLRRVDQPKAEAPPASPPPARPQGDEKWRVATITTATTLVVGSVILRLQNLVSPLLEAHGFRQTQTAFTVWTFLREGISWLHPQLPVYGPPWEVPFEFPLFQAAATLMARATRLDIDPACRLTNLLFFYASALVLYLLCRKIAGRTGPAIAVVIIYLWSPFTILWSRASMIEYAAVTFALAYVYAVLCWLGHERDRWWVVPVAIVVGCLGALVKITTMAIAVPPLAAFLWDRFRSREPNERGGALVGWVVCVALMLDIPVAVGQIWVIHTDHVKAASPVTAWLTSDALREWNFGTLGQRLTVESWAEIAKRIGTVVLPYGAALLPLVAFAFWRRQSRAERLLLASMLVAAIFPVVLFFNLYAIHDYYLCAVTPCLAVLAGFGLHACFTLLPYRLATVAVTTVVLVASAWAARDYVVPAFVANNYDAEVCQFGQMLQAITPADRHIIVADTGGWNPMYLYYARRKGLMYHVQHGVTALDPDAVIPREFLQAGDYATLVCRQPHPAFK